VHHEIILLQFVHILIGAGFLAHLTQNAQYRSGMASIINGSEKSRCFVFLDFS
jgi:hypothetical protein